MVWLAVLITIVLHTLAVPVMIWALRGDQGLRGLGEGWWPGSDGGGGGSDRLPKQPKSPTPSGGLPLPPSVPPARRLRVRRSGVAAVRTARRPSRRRSRTPRRVAEALRSLDCRPDVQSLSFLRQGSGFRAEPFSLHGCDQASLQPEPPEGSRDDWQDAAAEVHLHALPEGRQGRQGRLGLRLAGVLPRPSHGDR